MYLRKIVPVFGRNGYPINLKIVLLQTQGLENDVVNLMHRPLTGCHSGKETANAINRFVCSMAGIDNPRQAFAHLIEVRRLSSYPTQASRPERRHHSQRLSDFMAIAPVAAYAHEPVIALPLFGLLVL
jgi:hypothetical protein